MRPQKIITINLVDENEKPLMKEDGVTPIQFHYDEQDHNILVQIGREHASPDATERQALEALLNKVLKEEIDIIGEVRNKRIEG